MAKVLRQLRLLRVLRAEALSAAEVVGLREPLVLVEAADSAVAEAPGQQPLRHQHLVGLMEGSC
jgi:hypothetical protein